MTTRRLYFKWTIWALAGTAAALGQEPTIRTTVPLVTVPVSVSNRQGRALEGLEAKDFRVLDEGLERSARVDSVDSGLAPVALITLIQTTDLSLSALGKVKKIGVMIPEAVVGANGEAAVVTFDQEIHVVQDFTRDADAITRAFRNLRPADSSGGRMIDAVDAALQMLTARPGPSRANLLIISETRDRGSKEKLADVVEKIQHTGVTVYSLSYSAYLTPFTTRPEDYQPSGGGLFITEIARLAKENTVKTLTEMTGGRRFGFATKGKLENELIRLGTEIHSRYLVSFTPELDEQPRFHRLQIIVKDHPQATVRARPGYWSGPVR